MKRLKYLDIARGIGILLIVLCHILDYNDPINIYICSFNVPIFFIISGCIYSNKEKKISFKDNLIKRSKLLIPYVVFSIYHIITRYLLIGIDLKLILKDIIKTLFFRRSRNYMVYTMFNIFRMFVYIF